MNAKLKEILKNVTVEPTVLLYFTTYLIVDWINTNLFIQKMCRENATVEPDLNTRCLNESAGVNFASEMNSQYRSIMAETCIIYAMFATCWSDEAGRRRRPLIFLPIAGLLLHSLVGCLHSYFWQWAPKNAALTELLAESLGGGIPLMTIATQIYICDVSTIENRTMRLGILHAVKLFALPLGKGSGGFLLRAVGFFYSYLLCAVLSAAAFLLAVIFVKDVSVVAVPKKRYFRRVVSLQGVRDSFKVIFKSSLGSRRAVVVVLLIIYVLMYFIAQGEKTVFYLLLRQKFGLDERDYGLFSIYKYAGVILGTVFCSIVLSKILKIHDGLIGAFAAFWDTISVIGLLLASQKWHLYAVSLFDIFHGTALSVSVSFLSKHYDSDEYGRLSSVLNVFLLILPSCHLVYNGVFRMTSQFFPSAFFVISIILNVVVFVLYCSSYSMSKKVEE